MAKKTDLSGLAGSALPVICKDYGEMCALLNEKTIKNGEKRRKQIDRWNRYLFLKRDGHKYIIKEIKENPVEELPKVNQRNTKYQSDGLLLLLDFIASEAKDSSLWLDPKTFVLYENDGFRCIGFCNSQFVRNNNTYDNNKPVSNSQETYFRRFCKNSMRSNLVSILNQAVKLGFINDFERKHFVKGIDNKHRIASLDEVNIIHSIEESVLVAMGLNNRFDLKSHTSTMSFYRNVSFALQKKHDINYSYKNFVLDINIDKLSCSDVLLDDTYRLDIKTRINKLFHSSLKLNMLKRIEKNSQEAAGIVVESEKNIAESQFSINIQDVNTETHYIYPPDHFEKWSWWLDEFICIYIEMVDDFFENNK